MLMEQLLDAMFHKGHHASQPPDDDEWRFIFKRLRELEQSPTDGEAKQRNPEDRQDCE